MGISVFQNDLDTYYCIDSIKFCMPYESSVYIYMRDRCPHKNYSSYYGVLSPYINKKMSRVKCDDLICKLIKGHPYMENAMNLEINFVRTNGCATEYYHCLSFNNDEYPDEAGLPLKSAILLRCPIRGM